MRARIGLALAALLAAAPAAAAKKPLAPGERIDLNQASMAQLMRLPGVGKKRAQAITSYRTQHPFRHSDEVTRVKGVSAGWYDRVKSHVAVSAAAPTKISPPKSTAQARPAGPTRGAR